MDFFTDYLKTLRSAPVSETTEHTFRGALQQLLEKIGKSKNAKIKILHEPKRAGKFGSPDFKISAGEAIIGYAENKAIGENLDAVLKSDQIKKYLRLTDNLLITNYLEWIWMRQGKIEKREILAFQTDLSNAKFKPDTDRLKAVNFLIEAFFSQPPKQIGDAKKLADALATRAKLLKDFLLEELERQQQTDTDGRLFQLFSVFKEHVFHELELAEFADAFAQNLVYGLFLASLNAE